MRHRLTLLPVLALLTAFTACGNAKTGDKPLARIDGKMFTEAEFALRLATIEHDQLEAMLADPERRRDEFNKLLRTRLFALAGENSRFGRNRDYRTRAASIGDRVLTQYYFDAHLTSRGGISPDEIAAYYDANPARFADESGVIPPLRRVMARVADSILVAEADLDSFFNAQKFAYLRRATADIAMIRTDTRQEAERAHRALRSGTSFADAASRFSNHASKDDGGNIGQVTQGIFHFEVGSQLLADTLFFIEPARIAPGRFTDVRERDGRYFIFLLKSRSEESYPDPAEIRDRLVADYIRLHKDRLHREAVDRLKEKYGLRLVSPFRPATERDLRTHYQNNAENYTSPETFELYHIQAGSREAIEELIESISSLEEFRNAAREHSTNPLTLDGDGRVGTVKRDFSLPYGIGTLPALFNAIDDHGGTGLLPDPVLSPTTRTWHAFWVVNRGEPVLKPFDRVRALVKLDFEENRIPQVGPNDTLAVIEKMGKIIRESDVQFLRSEIPESTRELYTRDNLVDYLAVWAIFSAEARALGLHREDRARALMMQAEDGFWRSLYQDSILAFFHETPQRTLDRTLRAQRDLFVREGVEVSPTALARDIAGYLQLTPADFDLEYHTNPERYMRDTLQMSFDEARRQIFQHLRPVAHARLDAHVMNTLKKRFRVRILDASLEEPPLGTAQEAYARAQQLHFDRRIDQALALYERMREAFPRRAGVQDSVGFGIAQLHVEQQRYQQALAEYRRVLHLRPESPNAYKAMFMIGFIQAEYLRRDEAAIRTFETMLEKYPDTDLSEDADWMIRNIRSGGELMPVLEDDFEDWGDGEE